MPDVNNIIIWEIFHCKYMKFRRCVLGFTNAVCMIMRVKILCCVFIHNEENLPVYNEYCKNLWQQNIIGQQNKGIWFKSDTIIC